MYRYGIEGFEARRKLSFRIAAGLLTRFLQWRQYRRLKTSVKSISDVLKLFDVARGAAWKGGKGSKEPCGVQVSMCTSSVWRTRPPSCSVTSQPLARICIQRIYSYVYYIHAHLRDMYYVDEKLRRHIAVIRWKIPCHEEALDIFAWTNLFQCRPNVRRGFLRLRASAWATNQR